VLCKHITPFHPPPPHTHTHTTHTLTQALHPPLPPLRLADVDATEGRPLVVGYLSPDLFTHSVSYFAEAPLAHHDPARVKHIAYSCVPTVRGQLVRTAREPLVCACSLSLECVGCDCAPCVRLAQTGRGVLGGKPRRVHPA
jgi:hypothetical protein